MWFEALGSAVHPTCSALLQRLAEMHADPAIGSARVPLLEALGEAARSLGPQAFVDLLPITVATSADASDSSWLLGVLRGHIAHAQLAFFRTHFLPLQQWLLARAAALHSEGRTVEEKNLRNRFEQVWALFPGFCACARDTAESFGEMARTIGETLNQHPEVRLPILQAWPCPSAPRPRARHEVPSRQGLTLLILTRRSHKRVEVAEDGRIQYTLTADAKEALHAVGEFSSKFLPIFFNLHQAEPLECRRVLQAPLPITEVWSWRAYIHTHTCWLAAFQEAIGAFASVSPPSAHFFFNSLLRKFLNLCSSEEGVTERCGLLELLRALSPTLEQAWPHASPPPAAPCIKESHAPSVAIAAAVPSRPPPAREPQRRVAEEGVQGAQSLGLEHTLSGQPCHDSCARRQVLAALLASPLPPGLLMEMRSALDEALSTCAPACMCKRLGCWASLLQQSTPAQLEQALEGSFLVEVRA